MRILTVLSLLLFAPPAFGELTKEAIRTIIKEEVRPIIKEEIAASEKRTREYIDLKIETVNTRIDGLEKSLSARIDSVNTRINGLEKSVNVRIDDMDESFDPFWIGMAIIGIAIVLPQLIILYDEIREQKIMQTEIRKMHEQVKSMQQSIS